VRILILLSSRPMCLWRSYCTEIIFMMTDKWTLYGHILWFCCSSWRNILKCNADTSWNMIINDMNTAVKWTYEVRLYGKMAQCWIQEALLFQRDHARHLSVEILQLQNISLENPIMWHYLHDSTFSRFDTIPECDRHTHTECMQTDRHTTTAYTALSIVSRGKNRPYCTVHQL